MTGFSTTAPMSDAAKRILDDPEARVRLLHHLIGGAPTPFEFEGQQYNFEKISIAVSMKDVEKLTFYQRVRQWIKKTINKFLK